MVGVGGLITLLSIRTSAALILVFSILVGSSCLAFREVSISQNLIAKIAIENQSVELVGTVVSDSKITASRVSGARINQKSINFLMRANLVTVAGKVSKVRIPVRIYSRSELTYYPGEVIKVNGKLGLTKERRVSAALSSNEIQILSYGNFLDRGTTQIRSKFRAELARHGSDSAALIPGVVLGDTSLQSSEFTILMRRVGLTHITAVSGANLAIVTGFILWISQWILKSRRKRIFISVFFLIGFIFLVRASPSVLRAAVMAAVLLFAKSEGEQRQSVPALGAAISLLLLVDPFQGVDAGFALSVFTVETPKIFSRAIGDTDCGNHLMYPSNSGAFWADFPNFDTSKCRGSTSDSPANNYRICSCANNFGVTQYRNVLTKFWFTYSLVYYLGGATWR